METDELINLYLEKKERKERRLTEFLAAAGRPFIVVQHPPTAMWDACSSVETVCRNNLRYFQDQLLFDWTDDLPYLEPWIGTGVYANAFGCEYVFRPDAAPHALYKYHHIEEIAGIEYPDYRRSPIMRMVLECIEQMKEETQGKLPIALTDTQSPFDTATLVLDAAEFFVACYTHEETVLRFMDMIAELVIEFSHAQAERIGEGLVARPGHIMPSLTSCRGISISDDNLAVASPQVNERISLPFDRKIGEAFGGLATRLYMPERMTLDTAVLVMPDTLAEAEETLRDAGCEKIGVAVEKVHIQQTIRGQRPRLQQEHQEICIL